jgi:hypothetical protein
VLHAHPRIVMGLERYATRYNVMRDERDPDLISLELFEPERFLDFRPDDTHRAPPEFAARHYEVASLRFASGSVAYVGDKVLPPNVWLVRTLANQFPQSKFVFIYRDQLRVCDSWQRRSSNPDDQWVTGNDYRAGHQHWIDGLDIADWLRTSLSADRVFLTRCEWFFGEDTTSRDALIDWLGLDLDESFVANHAERAAEFRRRERETESVLTADQVAELLAMAAPERVADLDRAAAACRDFGTHLGRTAADEGRLGAGGLDGAGDLAVDGGIGGATPTAG